MMTKIKTPVTIYTNGNGCKWINDAEGEAVDFVAVADALNRTADLEAEMNRILAFANIERLEDGSLQYKPKAVKYYCGEQTANRLADLEAKLATANARVQMLGDCLSGYTSMCVNCLEPDEMHDENGFVDMLDEIGKMICGDPKYPAKEVLAKSRELANEALTTISADTKGDDDGK